MKSRVKFSAIIIVFRLEYEEAAAYQEQTALILKAADTAVGIMAFHEMTGSVDFLGVHPQYREKGIAKAFCEKAVARTGMRRRNHRHGFQGGRKA